MGVVDVTTTPVKRTNGGGGVTHGGGGVPSNNNRRSSSSQRNISAGFAPSPSAAEAGNHNNNNTLRKPYPMRTRVDSTGSTRGAFGPIPGSAYSPPQKQKSFVSPVKSTPKKQASPDSKDVGVPSSNRRKKKRTPKKQQQNNTVIQQQTPSPEKLIGVEMDLGDMASLAMAGMPDNYGGVSTTSPLLASSTPPRHPPPPIPPHPLSSEKSGTITAGTSTNARPPDLYTTTTAGNNHAQAPPDLYRRSSSVLSLDNDQYFRQSLNNNNKGLPPRSDEKEDTADAPLPFFENIKRLGKVNREDSLRYSEANMETLLKGMRLSSFQDSGETRFSDSGEIRPSLGEISTRPSLSHFDASTTSLNREVSLFGTNLLDDMEAGAAAAEQELQRGYGSVANHPPYSTPSPPKSFPRPTSSYQAAASQQQQQEEIALFSSMVQGSAAYDDPAAPTMDMARQVTPETPPHVVQQQQQQQVRVEPKRPSDLTPPFQEPSFEKSMDTSAIYVTDDEEVETTGTDEPLTWKSWIKSKLDPTPLLAPDIVYEDDGTAHYEEPPSVWSRMLRTLLYTPEVPEFTSLQQFSWAILLGIAMGMYTAVWKNLIEWCVEFTWKSIPLQLYEWGIFSDLEGNFPLPHYMWICPSIFGGILSYIFCILPKPIPGQNEWIKALHAKGVQDHETFWTLFFLSTAGMASGLSLGPELPLVLTAGMIGSCLGVVTRQSILSARAMNLTAASAAVAGFFGFPMAGALFVLEIPHRMGLQYFEALSPATIASIVAVLVNRMILQNDVTGYYNYPFLTTTLPSHVFYIAIVYGLVGALVGVVYCDAVLKLKKAVHDWFHKATHNVDDKESSEEEEKKEDELKLELSTNNDESKPLMQRMSSATTQKVENKYYNDKSNNSLKEKQHSGLFGWMPSLGIAHEPHRAAVAGTMAGFLTGVVCMFVPHCLFWGEAQLQTLIDKGRTPLPVFGEEGEPTEDLIAYGYCLVDSKDAAAIEAGFSIGCAALISGAKILVVGLSLGTGIIGGHFWGPLFVGCVASHLFTDVMVKVTGWTGSLANLSAYPCVAILCIMGSSHVVTFRAHMAIMLILTLTISAFYPDQDDRGTPQAGDYSAVFPLLVVSCFVSLMITRDTVFYKEQRSRGDIMAAPEVLCEPGKEGTPMVVDYVDDEEEFYESDDAGSSYYSSSSSEEDHDEHYDTSGSLSSSPERDAHLTAHDIEAAFEKAQRQQSGGSRAVPSASTYYAQHGEFEPPGHNRSPPSSDDHLERNDSDRKLHTNRRASSPQFEGGDQLAELLAKPMESTQQQQKKRQANRHRRVRSTNDIDPTLPPPSFNRSTPGHSRTGSMSSTAGRRSRSNSVSSRGKSGTSEERLMRVNSFGELKDFHPSLFDHARQRASSVNRPPSLPKSGRHSRQSSQASASGYSDIMVSGALSHDDVERSFGTMATSNRGGSGDYHRVYGMP